MLRKRLTYSNVVSTIALVAAVSGGTAYAAATIGSDQIKSGAVTSSKIASNAVSGSKVKNGSLTSSDFASGTLTTGPAGPAGATGPAGPAGAAAASLGGVVNSFAGIVVNKGIVAVSNQGAGVYIVSFNRNVQQCVVTGNIGGFNIGGNAQAPQGGSLVINGTSDATPEAVSVVTRDSTGASANLGFHIIASC